MIKLEICDLNGWWFWYADSNSDSDSVMVLILIELWIAAQKNELQNMAKKELPIICLDRI